MKPEKLSFGEKKIVYGIEWEMNMYICTDKHINVYLEQSELVGRASGNWCKIQLK